MNINKRLILMRLLVVLLLVLSVFTPVVKGQEKVNVSTGQSIGQPAIQSAVQPTGQAASDTLSDMAAIKQNTLRAANVSSQSNSNVVQPVTNQQGLPHEYNLASGLKVILLEDKSYPFISCYSWYKVGSRDDPAGITGLTHLVLSIYSFKILAVFMAINWRMQLCVVGASLVALPAKILQPSILIYLPIR